ncbi:MAG: SDR family NAD(P)-dependent oxidoreductase [Xanthobacteraceae bacterium]
MTDLTGKHALVTGGGSGIGAAIAFAVAQAGAQVTICGRRKDELEFTAERHPNIHAQAADVTDETSIAKLYRTAQKARGAFAIVVANAGGTESAPAEKISPALWSKTLDVNLTGAFFSVQPALAAMRQQKWGRIIFIASTAGLKGYPYVAHYVAAKHGIVGLTRALATETIKEGITANAVCPGFTETSLLDRAVERVAERTKVGEGEARNLLLAHNPQGRFIQPQEVADAVVWLCQEGSGVITGQTISVSGGETW